MKHKKLQDGFWGLSLRSFLCHFSRDRFQTASPTLYPICASACQLYPCKSSLSREREGVHSGTGCNISFEALLSKWEGLERKRGTGIRKGVTKRTMTVLMIFFYGEGKIDLLHWWPWTTMSLMASKPRCPEVMASNTIWGGERRLITPLINYTLLQETPECGPDVGKGKVRLSLNSLCPLSQGGAAGATAAGHRHYFHNMSQLTSVMTCKC